jgi:hypothetical protein
MTALAEQLKDTRTETPMTSPKNNRIDYVEFAATDLAVFKKFYAEAFGWKFQDWGPDYASFEGAGLDGGVARVAAKVDRGFASQLAQSKDSVAQPDVVGPRDAGGGEAPRAGSTTVILYADDLEDAERRVVKAGGVIGARHEFPGGRRFHFRDPAGNELAVWTKAGE